MPQPVSDGSVAFTPRSVKNAKLLNFASIGDNSNKFYNIEIEEGIGDYPFRILTKYGRLGKNPKIDSRHYDSLFSAESDFEEIIRSKKKKGYQEIELEDGRSTSVVSVPSKARKSQLSSINDKILRFIGKIYQTTTRYITSNISTPLGKLSSNQVSRGLTILHEIEKELDKGNIPSDRLSDDFYSVIPVEFGSRVDRSFIINDYYKLNDKKDLLGVMSSVVSVQKDLESTLDERYKALGIKLKALSKTNKEYKRIEKKIKDTKASNHHFGIEVKEVYEVEDMKGFSDFNPFNCEVKELFHGSRNQNILGILQSGLRIKPSSASHTGSMFGSAIYFADNSTKSANYCWGFSGRGDDENFLFLCDVATGRIKEYDSAQINLRSAPRGYNSVLGKKGNALYNNEYMVYNENQVKIRYIVEIEKV